MDLERMAREDKFTYFEKGTFPALFFLQVAEGMARFEVKDYDNLKVLLGYCKSHGYQVEWTQALMDQPALAKELEGFPGGRFVAHLDKHVPARPKAADPVPVGVLPSQRRKVSLG